MKKRDNDPSTKQEIHNVVPDTATKPIPVAVDKQNFCRSTGRFITYWKDEPKNPIEKEKKEKKDEEWLENQYKNMTRDLENMGKEAVEDEEFFIESDDDDKKPSAVDGKDEENITNMNDVDDANVNIEEDNEEENENGGGEGDDAESKCPYCNKIPCEWMLYVYAVIDMAKEWESQFDNAPRPLLIPFSHLKGLQRKRRFDSYQLCERIRTRGIPRGTGKRVPFPNCVVWRIRSLFPDPDGEYTGFQD